MRDERPCNVLSSVDWYLSLILICFRYPPQHRPHKTLSRRRVIINVVYIRTKSVLTLNYLCNKLCVNCARAFCSRTALWHDQEVYSYRKECRFSVDMSTPSTLTVPLAGDAKRRSTCSSELFPAPVRPTTPSFSPAQLRNDTPHRAAVPASPLPLLINNKTFNYH